LFILKPEAGGFNAYVLLPLGSAVLDALAMILTRTKCRGENPLVLSLSLNVTLVSVGLVVTAYTAIAGTSANDSSFILRAWSPMDASGWLAMASLAAVAITASVGAATAYQVAPPATIATFDFAYVGFAGLWGILIFAEFPDARTILGIMLIVVAGIVAVRR
jgi:drug/metabolite transporter (DMT)-like permease